MSTVKGDSDFETRPSSYSAIVSKTEMLDIWEHLNSACTDILNRSVAPPDKSVESTSPGYTFTRPRRLIPFSKRIIPIGKPVLTHGSLRKSLGFESTPAVLLCLLTPLLCTNTFTWPRYCLRFSNYLLSKSTIKVHARRLSLSAYPARIRAATIDHG
jgi:hypothetical protein